MFTPLSLNALLARITGLLSLATIFQTLITTNERAKMAGCKWEIKDPAVKEAEGRAKWGDTEYERRVRIAAEKRDAFPDSKWEEQIVCGNQFESIALACRQEIFDKLADKDYRFWSNLVYKVVTGK